MLCSADMSDGGRLLSLASYFALVSSAFAFSTTLQGPQAQVSNSLNTMLYQRGAPDLPLSDSRFVFQALQLQHGPHCCAAEPHTLTEVYQLQTFSCGMAGLCKL